MQPLLLKSDCNTIYKKLQKKEEKGENKNTVKGTKAQEIFNQYHNIIYEIFQTILQKRNRFLKYRLKDCSNLMLVNRNIHNSVYDCCNNKKESIKASTKNTKKMDYLEKIN